VTSIPTISQVYMLYLAFLTDGQYGTGPESLETQLFSIDEIPWDQLAFHTVRDTLLQLSEDLKTGQFRLHCIDRDETPVSARI
ncbi:MAG: NUDIX hydrolase, partial [Litorivicinaceae bacterium]